MASKSTPADAPPSYVESQVAQKTGGSATSNTTKPSHLELPQAINGIPAAHRKSMEDELRPLPEGWVRQFDPKEMHAFYVDTLQSPSRSIWHHPYDDDEYLSTLSSEERERIQAEEESMRRPISPVSFDEKAIHQGTSGPHESFPEQLPPRPGAGRAHSTNDGKKKSFGEKLKEKATGMTKEEREVERRKKAEAERQYYEQHQKFRRAMAEAQTTGEPVFFAKDRDGRDVYVEPPNTYGGAGYGYGGGGYGGGQRNINPYSSGVYANPNARFIRPANPYNRGYGYGGYGGYGYGGYGGYGLGLPLAGGLIGGGLLGAALF